ncbi:MAG: hypothetical protein WED15_06155 [Akkermansiaceae bacterium]
MKYILTSIFLPVFVLGTAILSGCSRSPQVSVSNHSAVPLTNVIISGSGFSESIGTLAPAERAAVRVMPSGDSSLRLEFDAEGKHFTAAPDCYFENGPSYRVNATIAPDFSVKVDVTRNY